MSFFWKSKNFSSFLSIQYQMDFCKFGVNLIGREKITQLILYYKSYNNSCKYGKQDSRADR